jgi:HAD superfamily hydrolase (TIGR01490 family)
VTVGLALFDLDRTLIDCNSGRLWMMHEWRHGRIGARDVAWGAYWLARYSLGSDHGLQEAIEAAARTVTGTAEPELDARVRGWFDAEIRHRLRPGAHAAVEVHRARGDRVVIATSGTTYAARAAAEAWGFDDVVATRLEVRDGRMTGGVAESCVGAAKARAVEAWAAAGGHDLRGATFYTDSATDLELMVRVGAPVAVHPDRALQRIAAERGWPIARW